MATPIRFIVVPLGSSGDVYPMVWLARTMAARGHDVVVVAQAGMIEPVRRAGLRAVPAGSAEQQESVVRNPAVWHPRRGFEVLARHFPGWAGEMIPPIIEEIVPGQTVILGAGIAFAARIAAEARQVPLVTIQLQPAIFMSPQDSPVFLQGMEVFKRSPLWLRRAVFSVSRWQADRLLARPINRLRAEWGLTNPVRGILHGWGQSPDLVLGLFPEWYAPKQPDWPAQCVLTRFPLYDETAERPVSPEAEAFLAAGAPPVLLTPGSLNAHGREFFEAGLAACAMLGRRAMLVTPFRDQLPPRWPATAAHFDFLPFSRAFPRCAAVVHHGGIGTGAQAMAAGVPQLIMAMAHDQPDNAWRLKNLGVGDYLYPGQFRPARVAARLGGLLASEAVADACRRTQARMADQMPAAAVAELLEKFASRGAVGRAATTEKVMEKPH